MTPEEYLQQAYRLDQRIRLDTEEVKRIRELSCSVSAICYDKEHVPSEVDFFSIRIMASPFSKR